MVSNFIFIKRKKPSYEPFHADYASVETAIQAQRDTSERNASIGEHKETGKLQSRKITEQYQNVYDI